MDNNLLWIMAVVGVGFTIWIAMKSKIDGLLSEIDSKNSKIDELNLEIQEKDKEIEKLQHKFASFVVDMKDIGDVLNNAQVKYNSAFESLKGDNLLESKS